MCIPILGAVVGATAPAVAASTAIPVAVGVGLGGLALSAAGMGVQAAGQAKQTKYQAKMSERNQEIAEMQAADAERRGRFAEREYRRRVRMLYGSQLARGAGAGLAPDSGVLLSLLDETVTLGELDAMAIRENYAQEARGYRMQAGSYGTQANLYRSAGAYNVGTSLLTGVESIGLRGWDLWRQYR